MILFCRLFSDVKLTNNDKPVIKIPSKLKEAIRNAKESFERRLHEEQKLVIIQNNKIIQTIFSKRRNFYKLYKNRPSERCILTFNECRKIPASLDSSLTF